MRKKFFLIILFFLFISSKTFSQEISGAIYQCSVEEAIVYLNQIALLKGTFIAPAGGDISVILPSSLIPDSLSIVDDKQKVTSYYIFQNIPEIKQPQEYRVSWKSNATGEHKVELRYLVRDIDWRPSYSLGILEENSVYLIYGVFVKNNALDLKNVNLKLLAGEIREGEIIPLPKPAVALKAYREAEVLPEAPPQQVNVYHIYELKNQTIPKNCETYLTLTEGKLSAKKIFLWDTRAGDNINVVYKILNTFDRPLSEGRVRIYEKGIFMGSDFIKWTPPGAECEITMGATKDVRVKKTESAKKVLEKDNRYRYKYFTELEIKNYTDKEVKVKVIEPRFRERENYKFKIQPEELPGDLFQWEIKVPANSTEIISYESLSQLFW